MSKGKRNAPIKMIPIDRINILNPRVRNKKIFDDITHNIVHVGLKRPITVTMCHSRQADKDYDLICGQGRLEAFQAVGQTQIPAFVIDATQEQALIMSLVENLARRQHRSLDLLQGVALLKKQGYDPKEIAEKTGLSEQYAKNVLHLIDRGEERLVTAVEAGHIPLSVAVDIAQAGEDDQRVLQEAYEKNILRGKKLMKVKALLEQRRRRGKTSKSGSQGTRNPRGAPNLSANDVLRVYEDEVTRKKLLTRKANHANNKLTFFIAAMGQLLKEDNFNNLLRAEGMVALPKQLKTLIEGRI
jgi:ParB family transcriptional regulator, chromosome partitioning protein